MEVGDGFEETVLVDEVESDFSQDGRFVILLIFLLLYSSFPLLCIISNIQFYFCSKGYSTKNNTNIVASENLSEVYCLKDTYCNTDMIP